ncbi:MAG: amidohydrolase family protein [Terriglobia bacterium]
MPNAENFTRAQAEKKKPPIDALEGPKLALSGQVVTMDAARTVLKNGVVFIEQGGIVAVRKPGEAPPTGFEGVAVVDTRGTIYPGLIELHNHLSYNILRLWDVPRKFGNRGQWAGIADYQTLVSGPMGLIGQTPGLLSAVVRYVECKCLLGGVTTSQGIELFSNKGARRYYRGIVRNVEQTDEPGLPEAATRIADVDASDAKSFLARLATKKCFLLHLAEGVDATARRHFSSLEFKPGQWAITSSLAGIHCTALERSDFDVMAEKGASMVWSPLSNLLLYGGTARIAEAKQAGVRIGLGSDWSPSGSKNLLGELKVARLASQAAGGILSDSDILALATTNAAAILHWQELLGSIEAGKRADFLVLDSAPQDPYAGLLKANESAIQLVMINGVARYGEPAIMKSLGVSGESYKVGGEAKVLNLKQATSDPDVALISLTQARKRLTKALKDLPKLKPPAPPRAALAALYQPPTWFLALDEIAPTGMDVRPHLPLEGRPTMLAAKGPTALKATPPKLHSLKLDPITVVDDPDFLDLISKEVNLPEFVKQGLPALY